MLKLVTAIIKPFALDAVKDALKAIGIQGLTVTEVRGFGRQGGHTETYRGTEYTVDLIPKLRLDIVCSTNDAPRVVDAIAGAANTNTIGDGKVWVLDVEQLLRIRTGEHGDDAI
jgi:nitrogen regulatory protein P-II 1